MEINKTQQLEETELFWLKKINDAGYRTPYEPEDDGSLPHDYTYMIRPGGKYRRYIVGFDFVDYSQLRYGTKQVREMAVDDAYVKNELHSKIERKGGLQHPSITTETEIDDQLEIGSGHHRARHEHLFSDKVPVIIASKLYNVETGQIAHPHEDLRSRVQTNKGRTQLPITLKGGVIAIKEAFDDDAYFEGANPSGKLPERTSEDAFDWDDLCEAIFGDSGNFTDKATRTKLRNLYKKSKSASMVVDMSQRLEQNDFLKRNSCDEGETATGKRKVSHKHFDNNNNCLVLLTDNNGRHFEEKAFAILTKAVNDDSYKELLEENDIKYIDIYAYLYNPSVTKPDNDDAYNSFERSARRVAKVLNSHPDFPLKVRKCVRAKMLQTNPKDVDKIVIF